MSLSKKDRAEAIRALQNFSAKSEMQTIADTFMHFDPEDENEKELYEALGWALMTLKVQDATLTAYIHSFPMAEREKVSLLAAELLAVAGTQTATETEKKEPAVPTVSAPQSPFRLIKGGK